MGNSNQICNVQQRGGQIHVEVKIPRMSYLSNIMRANCFPELHDLFKHAHNPPKEFTESYAAFQHLRGWLHNGTQWVVYHIGDGAHARTAALFAFLAPKTVNVAIDPATNIARVNEWRDYWGVKRFYTIKGTAESVLPFIRPMPTLVTFVHAHVDTASVLNDMPRWDAAFTMACCQPGRQLCKGNRVVGSGVDWAVLSEKREYQVLTPDCMEVAA